LLPAQNLGHDCDLSPFCAQHRSSAHLWLALHAHRRADRDQTTIVSNHVGLACNILEPIVGLTPRAEKPLPKQTVAATKRPPVSRRAPASKKAASVRAPATPHQKARKGGKGLRRDCDAFAAYSSVTELPPAPASPPKTAATTPKQSNAFDNFDKFFGLLRACHFYLAATDLNFAPELATRLLGLLTHVLLKIHLLDIARRLCEQSSQSISDGKYIIPHHSIVNVMSAKIISAHLSNSLLNM
jgi:separase